MSSTTPISVLKPLASNAVEEMYPDVESRLDEDSISADIFDQEVFERQVHLLIDYLIVVDDVSRAQPTSVVGGAISATLYLFRIPYTDQQVGDVLGMNRTPISEYSRRIRKPLFSGSRDEAEAHLTEAATDHLEDDMDLLLNYSVKYLSQRFDRRVN